MSDFLEEKKREMRERLDELRPLVSEYERLEAAMRALDGADGSSAGARRAARGAGHATPRRDGTSRSTSRGRPVGSGKRHAQTLDLVVSTPGITINELADRMGIKNSYLYRVLPDLQQNGKVTKRDKKWYPTAKGKAEVHGETAGQPTSTVNPARSA